MGSLSPTEVAVEGPFTHEFIHTRGVRLHAATAGNPQHPLIVLLHDHSGGWFDYLNTIAPLADAGFHVAALDMRGFGMSDKPPSGYGIRYAVGDIAGAIQSLGHVDAHIVGCGSGGAVAWTLAANYPTRVASLTSVCAAFPTDYRRLKRTHPWLFLPTRLDVPFHGTPQARQLRRATHPSFHHSADFNAAAQLRATGANIAHVDDAMRKNARLRGTRLPTKWQIDYVSVPTLVMHGEGLLCPHFVGYATRRVRGAGLRVAYLPDTKALPHLEKPQEFARELLGFLS